MKTANGSMGNQGVVQEASSAVDGVRAEYGLLSQVVAFGANRRTRRHPECHGDMFHEARQQLPVIRVARGPGAGARSDHAGRLLLPSGQQQGDYSRQH